MKLLFVIIICLNLGCNNSSSDKNLLTNGSNQQTAIPEVPKNIVVGNPTSSSLTILWDLVSEAESYQVFYDTNENGTFVIQTHNTAEFFVTHSGLSSATTYYYKVRATNSVGSSPLSSVASGITSTSTPPPGTKPATPSGLNTSGSTSSSINISWNAVSGAISYQSYLSTNMLLSSPVQIYNNSGNSFTATGLSSGTTYYFGVKATNSYGSSAISIPVSGTTLPAIPTGITVGSATSTSLTVSWNNVNGSSYQINRSQSSSFTNYFTFEVFASPFTDTGLLGKRTYYYRVRAVNSSGGVSAWSGIYSGTTL